MGLPARQESKNEAGTAMKVRCVAYLLEEEREIAGQESFYDAKPYVPGILSYIRRDVLDTKRHFTTPYQARLKYDQSFLRH